MKKFAFAAALAVGACLVPTVAGAQSFAYQGEILINDLESFPTGIATIGEDAYVVGFAQRRVIKVEGVVSGTPAKSIFARTDAADTPAGDFTWAPGRGLVSIDFRAPDQLMVAGAADSVGPGNGNCVIYDLDDASVVASIPPYDASNREIACAAFYGPSNIIGMRIGKNMWQFNSTLSGFTGAAFYSQDLNSYIRDIAVAPDNTAFFSHGGVGNSGIDITVDDPGNPTADSLSNNLWFKNWYDAGSSWGGAGQGVAYWNYNGNNYVMLAVPGEPAVHIVNIATGTLVTKLNGAEIVRPFDVAPITVADKTFILVTQVDADTSANGRVSIFGVDGATIEPPSSAKNWELY